MISGKTAGRVAVLVVNYRTPDLAVRCVHSIGLERQSLPHLKVLVVDGGSADGSAERLRHEFGDRAFADWVEFVPFPINGGFGWANNQGILRLLKSSEPPDFIHLLNPDTEIDRGAIVALSSALQADSRAAAVGSQLLEPDGSVASSAFCFPTVRGEFARGARTGLVDRLLRVDLPALPPQERTVEVDWVTGASVMLRVDALKQAGLFDDGFFMYHEELELMWRLRQAGWRILHQPASRVRHIGGAASGVHSRPTEHKVLPSKPGYWYASRRRFFARTRGSWAGLAAGLLWCGGHLVWRARRLVGLARGAKPVRREFRDQLRHAFPRQADRTSGHVGVDQSEGLQPHWMRHSQ